MSQILQEIESLIHTTSELPNKLSTWQDYEVRTGFSAAGLGKDIPYQEVQEPTPKLNPDSTDNVLNVAAQLNTNQNKFERVGNYTGVFTNLMKSSH